MNKTRSNTKLLANAELLYNRLSTRYLVLQFRVAVLSLAMSSVTMKTLKKEVRSSLRSEHNFQHLINPRNGLQKRDGNCTEEASGGIPHAIADEQLPPLPAAIRVNACHHRVYFQKTFILYT